MQQQMLVERFTLRILSRKEVLSLPAAFLYKNIIFSWMKTVAKTISLLIEFLTFFHTEDFK